MASTRTPLQPTEQCELFHTVGCHVYLVRYPAGQEDRARECTYRWVRNPELAFGWPDAANMCETLPDPPLSCDDGCNCDACAADRHRELIAELREQNATSHWNLEIAKSVIGLSFAAIAILIWRGWS